MEFDDSAYRVAAMQKYETPDADVNLVEVDRCTTHASDTLVVPCAGGALVKAWIFISDEEAKPHA